jgi:hypothetical protein
MERGLARIETDKRGYEYLAFLLWIPAQNIAGMTTFKKCHAFESRHPTTSVVFDGSPAIFQYIHRFSMLNKNGLK